MADPSPSIPSPAALGGGQLGRLVDHLGDFRPAVADAQALGKVNESLGLWLLAGGPEVYPGFGRPTEDSNRKVPVESPRKMVWR